jgi:hypothetical protein
LSWHGAVFGSSLAAALVGGLVAVLSPRPREAALGLMLAMAGVGGVLLALESAFVAAAVWIVLGAGAGLALRGLAGDEAEAPAGGGAVAAAAAAGAATLTLLAWAALAHPWRAAAGQREVGAPWIGFRLLSDHLLLLLSLAFLLGLSGLAAVLLSRSGPTGERE